MLGCYVYNKNPKIGQTCHLSFLCWMVRNYCLSQKLLDFIPERVHLKPCLYHQLRCHLQILRQDRLWRIKPIRCLILSVRGCVKSPTSVRSWPDNLFISGGNPHLTSRFCGVVLGPTTISKMVSEPLHDSGPPVVRFPLSGHPSFMFTLQMSNPEREGVC
jgi:hypothetical protein